MFHSAYGMRIQSNVPIPGLTQMAFLPMADVSITLQMVPCGCEGDPPTDPVLTVHEMPDSGCIQMSYSDGTEFFIDQKRSTIKATWPETLTLEDTATYLLGPVFGFLLRLRGVTCLHASAIAVDGKTLVLIGQIGAGKSTTAAALAKMGYPVLAEDVVALFEQDNELFVHPGYPLIRLWPDSVQTLYGAPDALPLLTPNWDKRYLPLTESDCQFQPDPLPLAAIYFLDGRSNEVNAPFIESMPVQTSMLTLIANTYANKLVDPDMRQREFEILGRLVNRMPLRRVTPHSDIARLGDLCQVVLDDFRRLAQPEWIR